MHSSPVSILDFLLVEPPGLMLSLAAGDTTCSTSLQIKKQRQKRIEKVLSPRCRSLNTMLAISVFGYLESLQEVWSFRVDFGSQVVLPPHRRWDLRTPKLRPLGRKPLRERFICQKGWRCTAHRDVSQLKIV